MVIFPLGSWWARAVLILIAIGLGLIWSMLVWPHVWRKLLRKHPAQSPPEKKGKK